MLLRYKIGLLLRTNERTNERRYPSYIQIVYYTKKDVYEFTKTNVVLPLNACMRFTLDVARGLPLILEFQGRTRRLSLGRTIKVRRISLLAAWRAGHIGE